MLRGPYRDATLCEMPPNGLGVVALYALAILDRLDVDRHPVDSAPSLHLQIEALKRAFARLGNRVGDPRNMDMGVDALMSQEDIEEDAGRIDPLAAADPGRILPAMSGTVYLAAGDASGMMVSFIQSNYMGFGSGVVVPGTGIALQNRGACFVVDPEHPNCVAPGKRPYHTIIPCMALRDGALWSSFGVMGGFMQPQGHLQMIVNMVDFGMNPQEALDAPRFELLEPYEEQNTVAVEHDAATQDALQALGHTVSREPRRGGYGGGQIITVDEQGVRHAGSDPRKDGCAVAY